MSTTPRYGHLDSIKGKNQMRDAIKGVKFWTRHTFTGKITPVNVIEVLDRFDAGKVSRVMVRYGNTIVVKIGDSNAEWYEGSYEMKKDGK